jgi:hypothetical protein
MGYPDPPDFRSGEPLAAWFLIGLGEGRTLGVATQGETANKRIQRALNDYFAGRNVVSQVVVDGVIGDRTLAALEVAAREHESADPGGGYGQIKSVIQGDRRARRLSPLSYRWGLWLAYVRPDATMRGRTYGDVVVAANAQYPLFGQAPDDDRDAGGANLQAVTWLLNVQDPPRPPSRSETRTPVGSPQTVTTGTEPGRTGTSTGAPSSSTGAIAPAPSGTLARTSTAATSMLETQYAGVAGKWWLLGALVVGGGYLAMKGGGGGGRRRKGRAAMRSGSRARRASRRYSRRRAR